MLPPHQEKCLGRGHTRGWRLPNLLLLAVSIVGTGLGILLFNTSLQIIAITRPFTCVKWSTNTIILFGKITTNTYKKHLRITFGILPRAGSASDPTSCDIFRLRLSGKNKGCTDSKEIEIFVRNRRCHCCCCCCCEQTG